MTPGAQERAKWEFVVWSEEGQGRYSVCLHRGDLGSQDHICIGEAVSKDSAEHTVHHANEWLDKWRADAIAQAVQAERERCADALDYAQRWTEVRSIAEALRARPTEKGESVYPKPPIEPRPTEPIRQEEGGRETHGPWDNPWIPDDDGPTEPTGEKG